MSWWTLATSKHMGQDRMDCLTGLLLWRGGTVEFDWWDRIRKRLSSSSFLRRRRQACTGYIQPGLGPLSSLLWCLSSLALTSSCWTVTACQLHSSKQLIHSGPQNMRHFLPPRHERINWGGYSHGKPDVWGGPLLEWNG